MFIVCPGALRDLFSGEQDWDSDPHYVVLLTSGYTPDPSHETLGDIEAFECLDTDYSAQRLQGESVTLVDEVTICGAHDLSFGASLTMSASYLVIIMGDLGVRTSSDPIVGHVHLGNLSTVALPWVVKWDHSFGIFRFWDSCDCAGHSEFIFVPKSDLLIQGFAPQAQVGAGAEIGVSDLVVTSNQVAAHVGQQVQAQSSELIVTPRPPTAVAGISAQVGASEVLVDSNPPDLSIGVQVAVQASDIGVEGKAPSVESSVSIGGDMHAQYSLTLDGLRVEESIVSISGDMHAQYSLTLDGLSVESPSNPVQKILDTNPKHFWWFGGLEYDGEETMRDVNGDPIGDGSTDVYAVRDLVTGSWTMEDWADAGGVRFVGNRVTGGDEGLAYLNEDLISDASWVAVVRRNPTPELTFDLILEAGGATGDVTSFSLGALVTQSVDGGGDPRTGASLTDETAYYRWRDGSTRYAQAFDGDDSSWTVSGTGAAVWYGVQLHGNLLADILCIIVYDDGERVGELLDEGLNDIIEELKAYVP